MPPSLSFHTKKGYFKEAPPVLRLAQDERCFFINTNSQQPQWVQGSTLLALVDETNGGCDARPVAQSDGGVTLAGDVLH